MAASSLLLFLFSLPTASISSPLLPNRLSPSQSRVPQRRYQLTTVHQRERGETTYDMNSTAKQQDNQPTSNPIRRSSQEQNSSEQNRAQVQQAENQAQQPHQPQQPQPQPSNNTSISAAISALTTISTGRKIMQHIHPQTQSATWLATELLKRTDLSSGDICMFHCKYRCIACVTSQYELPTIFDD